MRKYLPALAFCALGVIWGSNFVYMKLAAAIIGPMQIVLLRVICGLVPVALFALMSGAIRREHVRYMHHFAIMSVMATVLYYYCFVKGVSTLYSGIAGALSGATPLFSFLLGMLFLAGERATIRKVVGLITGFAGILLIAQPWKAGITSTTWKGIGYISVGSLSLGASFIYAKRFITGLKIPVAALTTYQLFFAAVIIFLFTDTTGMQAIWQHHEAALGLTIGLGLLGTGLAYLIYYYIIEQLGALTASSATYIPPVVALVIGVVFVGEPISPTDYVATLCILTGVMLLNPNIQFRRLH